MKWSFWPFVGHLGTQYFEMLLNEMASSQYLAPFLMMLPIEVPTCSLNPTYKQEILNLILTHLLLLRSNMEMLKCRPHGTRDNPWSLQFAVTFGK
jgi:hypothetical protein